MTVRRSRVASGASNLPPGVSHGDPNAPWNQPDPPTCGACGEPVGEPEDHADDCPQAHLDAEDLQEQAREPNRDWDAIKEDPTPSEAERYGLEDHPNFQDGDGDDA